MAKPKRSRLQREKDLVEISKLYFEGWPQRLIGDKLGLAQQQISYDLKALNKRWVESSLKNITDLKVRELAKIDNLEREYWEAWRRSTEDKEVDTTKAIPDKEDPSMGRTKEKTQRREGQAGDPRFLAGVQWCINKRAEIIGLDAGVKSLSVDLTSLSDIQIDRLANGDDLFNVLTSSSGG
jgi:hypothetical protein